MPSSHQLRTITKNLLIYILITLLPALTISYFIAEHEVKVEVSEKNIKSAEISNFHASNIENFLGETIGRLEMLATSIRIEHHNLTNIEKILKFSAGKDPRFSGFYWVKTNGDVLLSSNPTHSLINIRDLNYFQQAITSEKTSVSNAYISRVTGHFIIAIATPIVEHGTIQGVLVASINLREIEHKINRLVLEGMVMIRDSSNQILLKAGNISPEQQFVKSSTDISQANWEADATLPIDKDRIFKYAFLQFAVLFLTITNIFFILIKYYLLKKKIVHEREETEHHKLELIGNLAASTAHEIRNPLTGIKGLVKLLSEEYRDPKAQYYFDVIQQEITRINAIVSELLVLGKPTAYTLSTFNANHILKEIEPIVYSEANFMNVQLVIHYSEDDLLISCVKDHIKQVILNLAKNSLQAMPNGGSLEITLEKQANSCIIKVKDSGVGMEKEQLKKAFSPFYSLKKDGSGLGLTVCKRIIESYGGTILLESTPDIGTQVWLSLPLSK